MSASVKQAREDDRVAAQAKARAIQALAQQFEESVMAARKALCFELFDDAAHLRRAAAAVQAIGENDSLPSPAKEKARAAR
jgi:hypothetical protein